MACLAFLLQRCTVQALQCFRKVRFRCRVSILQGSLSFPRHVCLRRQNLHSIACCAYLLRAGYCTFGKDFHFFEIHPRSKFNRVLFTSAQPIMSSFNDFQDRGELHQQGCSAGNGPNVMRVAAATPVAAFPFLLPHRLSLPITLDPHFFSTLCVVDLIQFPLAR